MTKNPFLLIPTVLLTYLISSNSVAMNIIQAYELAKLQDPKYLAAEQNYKAALEAIPQARADFLPTIGGSLTTTGHKSTQESQGQEFGKYNTNSYSITLSQPIINYTTWIEYAKARETVKAAHATFYAAEEDLLIRVARQYFNVLKALDSLIFSKSQLKSFSRHLEQSQEKFKVGLIAITNVHEAKARKDDAIAQKIAAENSYEDQKEILREIIGAQVEVLDGVKKEIELIKPDPYNIEEWVRRATEHNFNLISAKHNLEVTKKQITQANSGHFPTLALEGRINNNKNVPFLTPDRTRTKEIGLTLSIPIFQGGKVISSQRQASHNYQAGRQQYYEQLRNTQSSARQAYRGVLTQISRVNALQQAVVSNMSALQATEAAFEVGTRTIVDVLNSQTDLLNAGRNHASARYDYLLETLNLKQAAGILTAKDLQYVNSLLVKSNLDSEDIAE